MSDVVSMEISGVRHDAQGTEPPPTRGANRDSGTNSANGAGFRVSRSVVAHAENALQEYWRTAPVSIRPNQKLARRQPQQPETSRPLASQRPPSKTDSVSAWRTH